MSAETFPVLLSRKLKTFLRKLELGDLVLLIYLHAFLRQWFWIVNPNALAWVLTVLVSLTLWYLHLTTKDSDEQKLPRQFWLLVALPLFVIYAMRVAFPDASFDVLDYRLINSERALRGMPLIAGDFFPVRFPFNPAPDMATGISRHLLGYRLGTILNYLVVLWVGAVLLKLLRRYFKSAWLACTWVLLLLLTEHLLFIVNNYMVDLLALPLLLEATRIALFAEDKNSNRDAVRLALYLGASAAFKLTNLAFAVPILLVYMYNCGRAMRTASIRVGARYAVPLRRAMAGKFFLVAGAFLLPLIPYTLYIYWQTGNPVFPLFNQVFRSPFWPTNDPGVRWGPIVDDPRWLHMKWWEILLWPVLLPFRIEHTAGNLGPHAGRISVGFIAAIIGLVLKIQRNKGTAGVSPAMSAEREQFDHSALAANAPGRARRPPTQDLRSACFIVLLGAILWSMLSGMLRYATYLELLGGLIVLALAANLYQRAQTFPWSRIIAVALWAILGVQAAVACIYVYRFEWATRPTAFDNPRAFLNDAKYFLRDYSLTSFVPARERALLTPVSAWAESSALESGIEVQLKSGAPALCLYMPEYFGTAESKARFTRSLATLGTDASDSRLYSLCYVEHFPGAIESIKAAGLATGKIVPLVMPYYSDHTRIQMALIEVLRADKGEQGKQIVVTATQGPLRDEYMHAEIDLAQPLPDHLHAGLKETIYLRLRNTGAGVWPAQAGGDGKFRLLAGNHWLRENNAPAVNDDGRSVLLYDLAPGEETEISLTVAAPIEPGNYVLEIDMVQEGVAWFASKGSKPLRILVKVE